MTRAGKNEIKSVRSLTVVGQSNLTTDDCRVTQSNEMASHSCRALGHLGS